VLEAKQLLRRFLDEGFDRVLIAQPVAAGNGVVGVLVEAVVRTNHGRRAAFGRHRVAAHRIDLGDDGNSEAVVGFGDGNGGAQTRAAATHQQDVMTRGHGVGYSAESSSSTRTVPSWWISRQLTL